MKIYVLVSSYENDQMDQPGARLRIVIQRLTPPPHATRMLVPVPIGAGKRLVWGMEHHHATIPTNSPRHEFFRDGTGI